MPTGLTSTIVVNRAIMLFGDDQQLVTGTFPTFDSSTAGIAAATLYAGVVQTVGRESGWDFSRKIAALVATGNTAPFPWSQEYTYPSDGLEIRQIMPASLADANAPLPVSWSIGNTIVGVTVTKVIWCTLANAEAVYTNMPQESTWDSLFTEEVVRLLASEMAMALAGKPETSQGMLQSAGTFGQINMGRDG
jgi:hypothetical protein